MSHMSFVFDAACECYRISLFLEKFDLQLFIMSKFVDLGSGDDSLVEEYLDQAEVKSPQSPVQLHEVTIVYPQQVPPNTTVYLQYSFDKFETFNELSRGSHNQLSIPLSLPSGSHLYRFYVESVGGKQEFTTDETKEI